MRGVSLFLTPLLAGVVNAGDTFGHVGGIGSVRPICDQDGCSSSGDEQVGTELIAALESQEGVTAVKYVELGELLCDTLDEAPDSPWLQFQISSKKAVTAERTSFSELDGTAFSDGQDRKIWVGDVVDPAPTNGSVPGSISMSWSDPCDAEAFLLKMVTPNADGTISIVTSMPCSAGSSKDICIVEMEVERPTEHDQSVMESGEGPARRGLRSEGGNSEDEPPADPDAKAKDEDIRMLTKYLMSATDQEREDFHELGLQRLDGGDVLMPSGRRLVADTTIELMVLYSQNVLDATTWRTRDMEDQIALAVVDMNKAFENSQINLEVHLNHTQLLPGSGYQLGGVLEAELKALAWCPDIADLRDEHNADLVQLIGLFDDGSGLGQGMPVGTTASSDTDGVAFTVVDVRAMFSSHTPAHELGHNLGCHHDKSTYQIQKTGFSLPEPAGYSFGYCALAQCVAGPNGQVWCDGPPFRTLMSYPCSPDNTDTPARVLVFSNPGVEYGGRQTGTATNNNARTIEKNMVAVANYRG